MHKKELTKFWKSFASGSGSRNFSKDSPTSAFSHNLAYISRESDRIYHENFITDIPLDREVLLNFGSNPDPESRSRRTYSVFLGLRHFLTTDKAIITKLGQNIKQIVKFGDKRGVA